MRNTFHRPFSQILFPFLFYSQEKTMDIRSAYVSYYLSIPRELTLMLRQMAGIGLPRVTERSVLSLLLRTQMRIFLLTVHQHDDRFRMIDYLYRGDGQGLCICRFSNPSNFTPVSSLCQCIPGFRLHQSSIVHPLSLYIYTL